MSEEEDRSPIGELLSKALKVPKKFWRTKRAIDRGVPLYDWEKRQLDEENYYAPWKFNSIQTGCSGGLAAVGSNLFKHVTVTNPADLPPPAPPPPPDVAAYLASVAPSPELVLLTEKAFGWLEPFLIPILTTCVVFISAWSSFRFEDPNQTAFRFSNTRQISRAEYARARRAYLYFDSSYGLFSQLFLSFALVIPSFALVAHADRAGTNHPLLDVLAGWLALYQVYVTFIKIPRRLFVLNGYSSRFSLSFPLWVRYVLYHLLGGLLLLGLLYGALQWIAELLARGLLRVQFLLA